MWLLTFCTTGFIFCGQYRTFEYPTEKSCYSAIEQLHKTSNDTFSYVTCSPISKVESNG